MDQKGDILCPRCQAVVLGAANCCWQCGEYVLVEGNGSAGIMAKSSSDFAPKNESDGIGTSEAVQLNPLHGGTSPVAMSPPLADSEMVIMAAVADSPERVIGASGSEILLGPTIVRDPRLHSEVLGPPEKPRDTRTGSPFAGANEAALPGPTVPKKAPNNLALGNGLVGELAWIRVLIEAAPYGCGPLSLFSLFASLSAPDKRELVALFPVFLTFLFGGGGLAGQRKTWCLAAMSVATVAAVIAWVRLAR